MRVEERRPRSGASLLQWDGKVQEIVQRDPAAWQLCQDRVLCYLSALGIPPVQSLEITGRVLYRTMRKSDQIDEPLQKPIREAMRTLRQILSEGAAMEYQRTEAALDHTMPRRKEGPAMEIGPVMPDIVRGRMIPEFHPMGLVGPIVRLLTFRRIGGASAARKTRLRPTGPQPRGDRP